MSSTRTNPAGPGAATDERLAFACGVARTVSENRCEDTVVLDLRGLSSVADFFVIATGTSDRQMHATLAEVEDFARTVGRRPFRVADSSSASWILADYVDVIVHLFDARHRAHYDLEALWGDAPRVNWQAVAGVDGNRADPTAS